MIPQGIGTSVACTAICIAKPERHLCVQSTSPGPQTIHRRAKIRFSTDPLRLVSIVRLLFCKHTSWTDFSPSLDQPFFFTLVSAASRCRCRNAFSLAFPCGHVSMATDAWHRGHRRDVGFASAAEDRRRGHVSATAALAFPER